MKTLLLLAICGTCLSAGALPTYEPFTEFANTITTTGSNMVAAVDGTSLPATGTTANTAASGGVFGGVDLATGGLAARSTGEPWTSLNFSGYVNPGGAGGINGVDIALINNSGIFTASASSTLLPPNFPGYTAGSGINTMVENPAQPAIWNGTAFVANPNTVGNSAVLQFSQDIPRPSSGTKTVYVSYLFYTTQQGQMGAGNDGRYLGFLCQSNLVEGHGTSGAYQGWTNMFNAFGAVSPKYASYGGFLKTANASYYLEPCDAIKGLSTSATTFAQTFGTAVFVVGAYRFSSGTFDTNALWVNPAMASFGGATPPTSPVVIDSIASTNKMTDIGGLVLIDRVGSGGLGGIGTNYVANLLIGTTWSYVTGGPEFTGQPVNATYSSGETVAWSGVAVAAGQSVSYQWQRIVGGTTNNLTDGVGTAGGGATVSGSATKTLTLAGVTAADAAGAYQLVATASGTSLALASQPVIIVTDPAITANPVNVVANYGTNVTFTATATTAQATLSARWYFGSIPLTNGVQTDGSTVSGATTAINGSAMTTTLTLSNVTYLEDGNYSVQVTNNVNNASFSLPGTLMVNDPIILIQPSAIPVVIAQGGPGSVSVVAAGTGLTYQWYGVQQGQLSNSGDFSGVTTPGLMIANAQPSDADTYYVVVGGSSAATVQSSPVIVYVESPAVGPFSQSDWPPTYAPDAVADYRIFDPNASFSFPSAWNNIMSLAASGGDQTWTTLTLDGGLGYQMTGTYLSLVDPNWRSYTNVPVIDVLLNVYGNSGMYDAGGNSLPTTLREGQNTAGSLENIHQGVFPQGANNGQWNWVLLTFTNPVDGNGYRAVGDPVASSTGGGNGGVNNATVSLYGFGPGFTIRAVAMGPHGAFGTTNQINRFAAPANCSPEPGVNLAWIDFNQNTSNNLSVLNNSDLGETYTVQSGVGPAGDLRTAIQSSGLMEMPILNDYLGLPCNENLTMQVCVEFYDDPALAGTSFGPSEYATDYQGDLANYTGQPYTLTGSGQWLKVAFFVGPLNLNGVNTAPLTGGPLLVFNGTAPYIDRLEVGLIRTGTNALAGQIPDPDYHINPFICDTNYGYYAQWDPTLGITNNVVVTSGYGTTLAGPDGDQRIAEQPVPIISGGSASYLDWTLLNQVFGPNLQDNADVIMSLTYYDDPALAGNTLYPNVYSTLVDGGLGVISPSIPYGQPVVLQGSGKWQVAQFELPDVNFQNGSTQQVCRFAASAPVYVARVQFDVVRPCGPFEGIDYLQSLGMNSTNLQINLNWRGQALLQGAPVVMGAYNPVVTVTNTLTNVYTQPMTNSTEFFRLRLPAYPSYLDTNSP